MVDKNDADGAIVIGAGVSFKGEVTVPGRATVNGKFEGTLKAAELFVGQSGEVHGQIGVETADIYGKVEENMVVQQKLTVRATGTVSGAVTYSKVMVEEGGGLAGTFNMLSGKSAEKDRDHKVISLQQAE